MKTIREFNKFFMARRERLVCLCGSRRSLPLLRHDRYGIPIQPCICLNCGHIYSQYNLNERELSDFYRFHYRNIYSEGKGLSDEAIRRRLQAAKDEIFAAVDRHVSGFIDKPVYEWGASGGWNLVPFKEAGAKVLGFDLDIEMSESSQSRFGIEVKTLKDNYDFPRHLVGSADVVVCNHVLEHILRPLEVLDALCSLLKDDGILYLGLPYLEMSHRWGFKRYFHIAHVHYFSAPWFLAYAESIGLQLLESRPEQGIGIFRVKGIQKRPGGRTTFPRYRAVALAEFSKMTATGFLAATRKQLRRFSPQNIARKAQKILGA